MSTDPDKKPDPPKDEDVEEPKVPTRRRPRTAMPPDPRR